MIGPRLRSTELRRLTRATSVLLGFTAILLAGCRNGERLREESARIPMMGATLPALDLHDLGGQPVDLSQFAGRVVILNLWATWCIPCRDEMPELEEMTSRYEPADFTVVGISIDEGDPSLVTGFLEEFSISYPNFIGEGTALIEALGLDPGVPHTLLLDRAGLVQGYWRGRFHPFDTDVEDLIMRVISGEA